MTAVLLLALQLAAAPRGAAAPDTTCLRVARVNLDSITQAHLARPYVPAYVQRAAGRLDLLLAQKCGPGGGAPRDSLPRDSIVSPIDSIVSPAPDSVPGRDSIVSPDSGIVSPDSGIVSGPPGVAELPRAVPTWPAWVATAACTTTIAAARLQAAVQAAVAGEVVCLAPGDRWRGTLTLPARGDTGWVVVRTAPTPGQPAPGERVRPSHAALLATIEAPGTAAAVVTAPSARGWALVLLDVRTDSALGSWSNTIVDLATPPTPATFARDIVLDRLWIHGWPHRPLRRCVLLNSAAAAVVNSWLDECHEKGQDSQAIASWSGSGPFLIQNNTLRGAGENILLGGATPRFAGTRPSDVTITRNWIDTPRHWRKVWTKKQLVESKNSARVLLEGNVLSGAWQDGQDGYALTVKSANGGVASFRWASSHDWTIRRNHFVCVGSWLTIAGQEGGNPGIDSLARRIDLRENVVDSIATSACPGTARLLFAVNGGSQVTLGEHAVEPVGVLNSALATGSPANVAVRGLTIDGGVVLPRGRYGINGCTAAQWKTCLPGVTWGGLALIGPGTPYPGIISAPAPSAAQAAALTALRQRVAAATRGVVLTP